MGRIGGEWEGRTPKTPGQRSSPLSRRVRYQFRSTRRDGVTGRGVLPDLDLYPSYSEPGRRSPLSRYRSRGDRRSGGPDRDRTDRLRAASAASPHWDFRPVIFLLPLRRGESWGLARRQRTPGCGRHIRWKRSSAVSRLLVSADWLPLPVPTRAPHAYQACALPTELRGSGGVAGRRRLKLRETRFGVPSALCARPVDGGRHRCRSESLGRDHSLSGRGQVPTWLTFRGGWFGRTRTSDTQHGRPCRCSPAELRTNGAALTGAC